MLLFNENLLHAAVFINETLAISLMVVVVAKAF